MKKREFVELEKRLLPNFRGFIIKDSMMLIAPAARTLRGFFFDTSRWDKRDFYVETFFMPLCVPTASVHFTFGHRLKNRSWNADDPNLDALLVSEMQKDVPFLQSLQTPKDLAEALRPYTERRNPNSHEAFAYCLVQAGETAAALDAIDDLLELVNGRGGWEAEIGSRAQTLRTKLLTDPSGAARQLEAWEAESARNLGLEEFR